MKLEGCEIAHRSRGSCTRRDISLSELRWRKTHLRAQSLHELKSQGQLHLILLGGFLCLPKVLLHPLPLGRPHLLLCLLLCRSRLLLC